MHCGLSSETLIQKSKHGHHPAIFKMYRRYLVWLLRKYNETNIWSTFWIVWSHLKVVWLYWHSIRTWIVSMGFYYRRSNHDNVCDEFRGIITFTFAFLENDVESSRKWWGIRLWMCLFRGDSLIVLIMHGELYLS